MFVGTDSDASTDQIAFNEEGESLASSQNQTDNGSQVQHEDSIRDSAQQPNDMT